MIVERRRQGFHGPRQERASAFGALLGFAAQGTQQRLRAQLGECLREAALLWREALLFVEAHAQEAHGASLDDHRHGPQRLRAPASRGRGGDFGIERVVFAFGLRPHRLARAHGLEHLRHALARADAADLLQHLGRDPARREQVEAERRFVQRVQRRDVRAGLAHALLHHELGDLFRGHGAGQRERQLGEAFQSSLGIVEVAHFSRH